MLLLVSASIYSVEVTTIDGKSLPMDAWRGKTLLIVNVASKCGFTPQYEGLERLYRAFGNRGFVVLGFPCDQFGHQEPGTEAEIQEFCSDEYHVTFPLFSKINVNGDAAHPLFKLLKSAKRGILGTESIKWNFTKFLVSSNGEVLKRYGSADTPDAISADVEKLLAAPTGR
jgi:glutathione peroxidase